MLKYAALVIPFSGSGALASTTVASVTAPLRQWRKWWPTTRLLRYCIHTAPHEGEGEGGGEGGRGRGRGRGEGEGEGEGGGGGGGEKGEGEGEVGLLQLCIVCMYELCCVA